MDPIEILGSLLGKKARGAGGGADILKDILLGGLRGQTPQRAPSREAAPREPSSREPAPRSAPPSQPRDYRGPAGSDLERQARELEELLNVATNRGSGKPAAPQQQHTPAPRQSPTATSAPSIQDGPLQQRSDRTFDDARARQSQQALILVQAMVNAAKCDGQISQAEQQAILDRLDNPSSETIQFLREELAKPLDVREFAWSVPVGMEQQVYTMSLAAIDVDSDREQRYLRDLAHGLRLSPEVCEDIKDQLLGAATRR